MAAWEVEVTNEFLHWYRSLTDQDAEDINAAVETLRDHGPNLRRPVVGAIEGSIRNLKELCVGPFRVLFAFDPRRIAILLLGGDKTGEWKEWYRTAIPEAEKLYEEHLNELMMEGVIQGGDQVG